METARKKLKLTSIVLLILSALSLVRIIVNAVITGLKVEDVPQGTTESIVQTIMIIAVVFSVLLLIPQVYIGIKGLKVANKPDSSKGYITVAKVFLVLSVIAVITSVASIANSTDKTSGFLELIDVGLDVAVYFMFIKYATKVYKAA